jgi:DnaD/phage-associated family protein
MQHSFNIELAKEYGILEAIIINNLFFWIEKNKANDVSYYDGTYWTYNSIKALNELFPYASERKISYALKHLEEEEIIKTGNYNKLAYDRTLWYAFTEKGISILQKCCFHFTKSTNGFYKSDEPIPDINTDINTDNNNNSSSIEKRDTIYDFLEQNFGRTLNSIEIEMIREWTDNELTRYAIKQAVLNGKYNVKYINTILVNYRNNSITTVQQAQEEEKMFKSKKEIKKSRTSAMDETIKEIYNGTIKLQ